MDGFLGRWIDDQLGSELSLGELLKRTGRRIGELELMTRSAAIAFYAFSALVPFIVVLLTLMIVLMPPISLGSGSSKAELSGQMTSQLQEAIKRALPGSAVRVVENQIARIQEEPPYGLLSVGLIMSLYLASSVFQQVIAALNRIYGLEETRSRWKLYLTAMSMTALEATILIASLLTIVLWPQLGSYPSMVRRAVGHRHRHSVDRRYWRCLAELCPGSLPGPGDHAKLEVDHTG